MCKESGQLLVESKDVWSHVVWMAPFHTALWVNEIAENVGYRRLSEHNKSGLFAVTIFLKNTFIIMKWLSKTVIKNINLICMVITAYTVKHLV